MKSITRVIIKFLIIATVNNTVAQLPYNCNNGKDVDVIADWWEFIGGYKVKDLGHHESIYCRPEWDGWIMVNSDDFNGNTLDAEYWSTDGNIHKSINRCGYSSQYRSQEVQVFNGNLHLLLTDVPDWAERDDPGKPWDEDRPDGCINEMLYSHYTGLIQSKQMLPSGKYEIRVKIPQNDDCFPAFWQRMDWGTEPDGKPMQEVDGFEFYRRITENPIGYSHCFHDTYNNEIHFGLPGSNGCGVPYDDDGPGLIGHCPDINFGTTWFTSHYTWDPEVIEYGIDGEDVQHLHKVYFLGGMTSANACQIPSAGLYRVCNSMPDKFTNMWVYINNGVKREIYTSSTCVQGTPANDDMLVDWFKFSMRINCDEVKTITNYRYGYGCDQMDPTAVVAGKIIVDPTNSNTDPQNKIVLNGDLHLGHTDWDKYGTHLTLVAAEEVEIKPGFEAEPGSHFEAHVRSCNSQYFTPRSLNEEYVDANQTLRSSTTDLSAYFPELENSFFLYPNPATEQLNVYCSSLQPNSFLQVLSADGRLVMQNISIPSFKYALDISSLASGIYFLEMCNGGERAVKRFSKR